MQIKITRLNPSVALPEYQTQGSAAFDLAAAEQTIIPAGQSGLVPTGLIIATPENHVLVLAARSSLFKKKGLMLANGIGVIDSDYRGPDDQIYIACFNPGTRPVTVEPGERIAPGLILPCLRADFIESQPEGSNRGGFGSTG